VAGIACNKAKREQIHQILARFKEDMRHAIKKRTLIYLQGKLVDN
jgi:hypothetical protein